jgi:two-component system phosphate regulon sensor histidine kinase PhoR
MESTGAEGGALALQEESGVFRVKAASGTLEKYLHCKFIPATEPPGGTTSSPSEGDEPKQLGNWFPWDEEVAGRFHRLGIPIATPGNPPGFLELVRHRERGDFTQEERRTASFFAREAGNLLSLVLLLSRVEEGRRCLEAVLGSIGEGVLALDSQGRLIFHNPSAEHLLGLLPSRGAGAPRLEDLQLEKPLLDLLSRSLGEKREMVEEIRLVGPDRVLRVETRLFPTPGDETTGLVAMVRDITAEKDLERMREEFVSTLSHELRTPLTSIKAYAATLRREDVDFDRETQREFLSIIEGEADRLARLIKDLLETSRAESGRLQLRMTEVDISALAERVLEKMRPQAGSHHLRLAPREGTVPVRADPDRMEQVITNLLDNALKYSPPGSTVTLSVRARGDKAVVSVSDQGIGIPLEQQTHVFDKFHRVLDERSRHVQGTGLGLYLCRKIVEAHGGHIWVESRPGEGSTFHFSLPLTSDGEQESRGGPEMLDLNG